MTALAPSAARAESQTFTLALASAADVGELRAWLASAELGARAIYASGALLPREAEGVKLVRAWRSAGLVTLVQRRDPHDGRRFQFLCEKVGGSPGPAPVPVDGAVAPSLCRAVDRGDLTRLLDLLRRCAERSRPCPSNAELAHQLWGLRSKRASNRAQYLLTRLIREARVEVESRGTNAPRVVTIVAKGRSCGRRTAA